LTIDQYKKEVKKLWHDGEKLRGLFVMSTGLAGETGEVLEHLKKHIRDDRLDLEELKLELGDQIFYWTRICQEFGFDPEDVMDANVKKLRVRHAKKGCCNN